MKKYLQICLALTFTFAFSHNIFAQNKAKQTAACVLGTSMGALGGLQLGASLGPAGVVGGAFAGGMAAYSVNPACQNFGGGEKGSNTGSGSGSGASGAGGGGGPTVVRTTATRIVRQ